MIKQHLDSLTKEDWDTLFPVELVPNNPAWKRIYKQEEERIIEKLGDQSVVRIEHFGSTSITLSTKHWKWLMKQPAINK